MSPEDNSLESGYETTSYTTPTGGGAQVPNVQQEPPKKGLSNLSPLKLNHLALMITAGTLILILLIGGGVFIFDKLTSSKTPPINSETAGNSYKVGSNLAVSQASPGSLLQLGQVNELAVNGQLTVSKTLVLTPSSTPTAPVTGQIYYNQSNNAPYYYNGSQFVSLAPVATPEHVTSIGGVSGSISVGNGLQVTTSGQLSLSSTALQSLTRSSITPTVFSLQSNTSNLVVTQNGNNGYTLTDNSVVNSGTTGDIALITGSQTIGGSILSQSGSTLIDSGSLTVTDALSTNMVEQTAPGNDLNISAGNNSINFTAGGITFTFPTTGALSQEICTTGISCASGGGQAVILQPGSAQTDSGSGSSIFINNTGGGALIDLQSSGNNEFEVGNNGNTSVGGTLVVQGPSTTLSGNLTVQGSAGITVGSTSNNGTLNFLDGTSDGYDGTIELSGALTADQTYSLPVTGGNATICLSTGNCAGSGGGITGSGTSGDLAEFTGTGAIGNSDLSQAGSTLTDSVNLTVQGNVGLTLGNSSSVNGSLIFDNSTNSNTTTLVSGAPGSSISFTLPASTGTSGQCLETSGSGGILSFGNCLSGAGGGSGGVVSLNGLSGSLSIADATGAGSMVTIQDASTSALGLSSFNSSFFNVSSGAVSLANTSVTAGSYGGASTGVATFTVDAQGQVTAASTVALGNAGLVNSSITINNGTNVTGGGSAVSLGSSVTLGVVNSPTFSGNLTVQGSAGITVGSTSNNGTLNFLDGTSDGYDGTIELSGALTADQTYSLPVTGGNATICLSTGNCAGSGGGITGSGTSGDLAEFTGTGAIGNSDLSQAGSTLTDSVNLTVQGNVGLTLGNSSSVNGSLIFDNSTNSNTTTLVSGAPGSSISFTLPASTGTSGQCLETSGSGGILSFGNCLSGAGGGSGGVVSLNGLSGSLSIADATGAGSMVTIQDASTSALGLSSFNSSFFNVSSGAVSLANTSVTAGSYGGASTGVATFTVDAQGQVTAASTVALGNAGLVNSSITINNGTNVTGGGSAVSLGSSVTLGVVNSPTFSGNLTVQGSAGITVGSTSNNGTLNFLDGTSDGYDGTIELSGALTADQTYSLPVTGGNATICLSTGNCAGSGGGITGSGTSGDLAEFTGTGAIGNSDLSQAGSTLTDSVNLTVQGNVGLTLGNSSSVNGSLIFDNSTNSNTTTLVSGAPGSSISFTLPASTGTSGQCLETSGSGGILSFGNCLSGAGGGSGGVVSLNGLSGSLSIADATGAGSMVTIQDASTSALGLSSFNSSFFNVSSGAVSLANTSVTAGSYGGASTGVATFTVDAQGQVTAASTVALGNAGLVNSSITINNGTNVTGGGSAVSLGSSVTLGVVNSPTFSGNLTVQGSAGITVGSTSNNGTLNFLDGTSDGYDGTIELSGALTADQTYSLPVTGGNATICLSTGNCAGSGGGITGSGTSGDLAEFTGTGAIGNSDLSQAGSTLTDSVNLTVQGNVGLTLGNSSSVNGSLIFDNSTNSNTTTLVSGAPGSSISFTLPASTGTSGQCLETSGSGGILSFGNCLSGAGGGSGGVVSLNGLSGSLSIADATGAGSMVTIQDASTSALGLSSFNSSFFNVSSGAVSLANTSVTAGSYGGASTGVATFTVDAQGQVTAASTVALGNAGLVNSSITINNGTNVTGGGSAVSLGSSVTLGVVNSPTFSGTLTVSTIDSNSSTDLSISAGSSNAISFTSDGRTFILPTTGTTNQTICTTGITCASGGGQAVILQPGSAQTDTGSGSSIFINNTGGGNLLELQSSGSDAFLVGNNGNLTIGTAGNTNGEISLTNSSNSNLSTIETTAPTGTGTATYTLPALAGGTSDTICLKNLSNCGGSSAISGSGTSGDLAEFTGSGSIGNSILSESGSALTDTGSLDIQGSGSLTLGTASSNTGSIAFNNASNSYTTTLQSGVPAGSVNLAFTLPTSAGSNGQCLETDGTGVLSFGNCLSGAGGGSGGVVSLNGLSGSLSIADATGAGSMVTIQDASTSALGLSSFNSSFFNVSSGAVSLANTSVTAGSYGGASTGVATFTVDAQGQVTAASTVALGNAGLVNSSITINNGTNVTGGGSAVSLGSSVTLGVVNSPTFSGNLTVQGSAGITVGSTSNNGTLNFLDGTSDGYDGTIELSGALTADQTYSLPVTGGNATICLSTGNCAGSGGGITGSGTSGDLAEFTGTGAIGNSDLSQAGSTLTDSVNLTVQGNVGLTLGNSSSVNGSLIFDNSTNSNTTTLVSGAPGSSISFTLPASTGTSGQCLETSGSGGILSFGNCLSGAGGGSGGVVSLNGLSGSLSIADATGAGSMVTIQDASTSALGLSSFNSSFFNVSSGAVSLANTSVTAGSYGGASTGVATFTVDAQGQVTAASTVALGNAGLVNSSITINNGTNVTGGGSAVSLGSSVTLGVVNSPTFSGNLTVQGSAGITVGSTSNNGTLNFLDGTSDGYDGTIELSGALTADQTYSLPVTGGNATICLSTGNCAGSGGGITGSGTSGDLAEFTGTGAIGNSDLSQAGSTLTDSVNLTVQGNVGLTLGNSSSVNGSLIFDNSTNSNTTTLVSGAPGSSISFTLPASTGTSGQCLETSGSGGILSFGNCLSGAGGGSGGVVSLNGLSGSLSIADATGAGSMVTIQDASTSALGLSSFNSSFFNVSSGAVSLANTSVTAGSYGGASTGVATFTVDAQGQVTAASTVALGNAGLVNSSITINNGTNVTGGGSAVSLGSSVTLGVVNSPTFSGNLTVQGSAGITVGSTSNNGTLNFLDGTSDGYDGTIELSGALTADQTYSLPVTGGNATICLSTGNCAGSGGGITGSGTSGDLAEFTGTGAIGNSDLSQAGSTLTDSVNLTVQGNVGLTLGNSSSVNGSLIFDNSTNSNTTTLVSGAPGSSISFTLPASTGTSGQCLETSGSGGILSFGNCLSGAGGGSGGVVSLNGLSGSLSIADATGAGSMVTIQDASTSALGLSSFNSSFFNVSSGAVSLANTSVTAGSYGGASTGVATFTVDAQGQVTAASTVALGNAGLVNSSITINNGTNVTGGGSAVSLGSSVTLGVVNSPTFSGNLTVQGSAGITVGSTSNNGTLNFLDGTSDGYDGTIELSGALTADQTYSLPVTGGNATICLSTGVGCPSGSGITGSGTSGDLAEFTGTGAIGNSDLSQAGNVVTDSGSLVVQGSSGNVSSVEGASGQNILNLLNSGGITAAHFDSNGNLVAGTINSANISGGTLSGSTLSSTGLTFSGSTDNITGPSGSSITLDTTGSAALNLGSTNASSINEGNANTATAINGSSIALQAGSGSLSLSTGTSTGNISLTTNNASSSIIAKSSTDTTTAFEIQDANSNSFFTADSSDDRIDIGTLGTPQQQLYVSGSIPSAATGSVSIGGGNSVYVQGNYAYVVAGGALGIYDVSNPADPTSVGSASASSPKSVYVQGNYAYVAGQVGAGSGELQIYNVSNPADPTSVGTAAAGSDDHPESVYVQGNYAYVATNGGTLYIYNVSNPADPTKVGSVSTGGGTDSVYVQGNYAYTTSYSNDTLYIYNVSNPADPTEVGSVSTGTTGSNPYSVYVQGNYAYVANYGSSTLGIYNVSNPNVSCSSSCAVGSVSTGSDPYSVYVQGNYAYVANYGSSTLGIYNVSNPNVSCSSSCAVGSVSTGSDPDSVYVQGNYAYVASGTLGIYDVGGAYIQQLSTGGTQTGTLSVTSDASIGGGVSIQSGLTVGTNAEINGALGVGSIVNAVGALQSGTPTSAGSLVLQDGSGHSITFNSVAQANSITISVPADTNSGDTLCLVTLANCSGSAAGSGDSSYIWNTTSVQPSSNFDISGNGIIGGTANTGTLDVTSNANVDGTLSVGTVGSTEGTLSLNSSNAGGTDVLEASTSQANTTTITIPTDANSTDILCLENVGNCSGSGVTTIGALDGGTANANGATISGDTLYLQSASASYPGLVNNTTQSFSGDKTFTGTLTVDSTINGDTLSSTGLTFGGSTDTITGPSGSSITLDTTGSAALDLGNSHATTVNLGNSGSTTNINGSGVTVQAGSSNLALTTGTSTGNITFTTNNSSSSIVAESLTNSTSAFQIQGSGGSSDVLFNADTVNNRIDIGTLGTASGQLYVSGTTPTYVGESGSTYLEGPTSVYVQGNYAYVTSSSSSELVVYNISSGTPTYVGESGSTYLDDPHSVYVSGNYAYVTDDETSGELVVYNISSGTPTYVGESGSTYLEGPTSVYVSGNYAYVTDDETSGELVVYNISSGTPTYVGESGSTYLDDPHSVYVSGNYAYVTDDETSGELVVYNISSGTPTYVGESGSTYLEGPTSVYVQGNYAYVTSSSSSELVVYNISSGTPTYVGENSGTPYLDYPTSVYVSGIYAYVTNEDNDELYVYNISSGTPTYVGESGSTYLEGPTSVYVQGNYAYVTDDETSGELVSYSIGGIVAQSLQAGNTVVSTLQVSSDALVSGDESIQGTLAVGANADIDANLNVGGSALFEDNTDSSTAFQIQNSAGTNLLQVNTSGNDVYLGDNSSGTGTSTTTVNIGAVGSDAYTSSVNIGTSTGGAQTVAIGSTDSTSSLSLQSGSDALSIQTDGGAIDVGTNNTANNIQIGSTTLSSGTQNIYIGNNNTAGGTTDITIGTGTSAAGTLTLQAAGGIDVGSIMTQTTSSGSSTGTISLLGQSATNANTGTVSTTVNGYSITLIGTNNTHSGVNILNGLSFNNVTAATNNTFNGLYFGSGYTNGIDFSTSSGITNYINSPNFVVNSNGTVTLGAKGTSNGVLTIASSAGSSGSFSLQDYSQTNATTLYLPTDTNASDYLCLQTVGNCSGANGGSGDTAYIANQIVQQASANIDIQSRTGDVAVQIQGASGENILNLYSSSSNTTPVAYVDQNGDLVVNGNGSIASLSAPGTIGTMLAPTGVTASNNGSGYNYTYEVTAVSTNGAETLASSASSTITSSSSTAPDLSLSWTAPSETNATVSYYKIYRVSTSSSTLTTGLIGTSTSTSFEDTGQAATGSAPALASSGSLSASTTYYYEVTALDGNGGQTTPSSQVSQATSSTYTSITLSWAPVTGARGYNVYRSTTSGVYTTDSYYTVYADSFTDTGATATGTNTAPPTTDTAYANNLSNNATATITIGSGTAQQQLYVGGEVPSNAVGTYAETAYSYPIDAYIQGNYAYVVNVNYSNLDILNIAEPNNPTLIGSIPTGSDPYAVYVQGNYAYVVNNGSNTMTIYNVANPSNPSLVGTVSTGSGPFSIYVQGNYAYVVNNGSSTLGIYNVSDPASPDQVGTVSTGSGPSSIYVQGNYAYVTSGNNELAVYNISNPSNPTYIGESGSTYLSVPSSVYVQGNYAYVTNENNNSLTIYNISNPASPSYVGLVDTVNGPGWVYVQGDYAYVTGVNSNNFGIYNISNPASPTQIGTVSTGSGSQPSSIYVQGNYAYVANLASSTLGVYNVGGAYIQQLSVGGTQTGTLSVSSDGSIGGDLGIQGGLTVGTNSQIDGQLGVAGGATIQGSTVLTGGTNILSVPGQPTVTPEGTTGSTNYSYTVTAVNAYGGQTTASTAGSTSTGNATLSSSNYNQITWTAVTGATSYDIYRTAGGSDGTGLIGSTTTTTFDDTGLAGSDNSSPSYNSTSQLTVAGSALIYTPTNTTTAFQVQNASGSDVLDVDTVNQALIVDGSGPSNAQLYVSNAPVLASNFTTDMDSPYSVAVSGNYAYVANLGGGESLTILNISNPAAPTVEDNFTTDMDGPDSVAVSGNYAYVANAGGNSLTILSISNPAAPTLESNFTTDMDSPLSVAVSGNYAYVANESGNSLTILNISNPAAPTVEDNFTTDMDGPRSVAVSGNYAYVANLGGNSLTILSISNPAAPTLESNFTTDMSGPLSVAVSGNYAYVANESGNSLTILNISNPAAPTVEDNFTTDMDSPQSVAVSGNYAYVANHGGESLTILNISNPAAPTVEDNFTTDMDGPRSVAVSGNYAYVANESGNSLTAIYVGGTAINQANIANANVTGDLSVSSDSNSGDTILNVDTATNTINIGNYTGPATDQTELSAPTLESNSTTDMDFPDSVAVSGNYAYVANYSGNSLTILNISNPAAPTLEDNFTTDMDGPQSVAVSGNYAYVANLNGSSLTILSISNPAAPTVEDNFTTDMDGPYSVAVSGNYAYVANYSSSSLTILNVSNPAAPTVEDNFTTDMDSPQSVAVSGNYAYVANYSSSSLTILNVSNPAAPTLEDNTTTDMDGPQSVAVSGNYAYVANYDGSSLTILNVSNPAAPTVEDNFTTDMDGPQSVAVSGNYAYVANYSGSSLTILNVSNPAAPTLEDNFTTDMDGPQSVAVSGNYAYVANYRGSSLTILQVSTSSTIAGTATNTNILGNVNILQGSLGVNGSVLIQGATSLAGGILGGAAISGLSTPSAPTVTFSGTTGTAATWSYEIVAVSASGGTTPASGPGSITTADNTTLSTSNYNVISWAPVSGAVSYDVYRTAVGSSPTTTGLIGTTDSTTFDDTGLAGNGATPPTLDTSGQLSVDGYVTVENTVNSTTAFQVQNASGTNIFDIDTSDGRVIIGSGSAGDTVGYLLVLDNKTTTGDPTGVNGAMYYNAALGQYRCYVTPTSSYSVGEWQTCGTEPIQQSFQVNEDFLGGTTTTGNIGQNGWDLDAITSACTVSYDPSTPAPSSAHPGIMECATPATTDDGGTILLGAGSGSLGLAASQDVKAGMAFSSASSGTLRVGMDNETTADTAPTTGVYWQATPTTSSDWEYCYVNATPTATCAASSVAISADTFESLEIEIVALGTGTSQVNFFINGIEYSVSGVTVNTTNLVSPDMTVFATAATAVDLFANYYQVSGLTGNR